MIEVLVTIVIIATGLLGIAGLQVRLQVAEMESYQRAQALVLLGDMANRVATNRTAANSYVTTSAVGAGMTCAAASPTEMLKDADIREWCNALQGAAEVQSGTKLGAVVGGRGCVQALGNGEYLVTIAWQGQVPLVAPPSSITCGANLYDGAAGAACINDLCRRFVTTVIRIAALT